VLAIAFLRRHYPDQVPLSFEERMGVISAINWHPNETGQM